MTMTEYDAWMTWSSERLTAPSLFRSAVSEISFQRFVMIFENRLKLQFHFLPIIFFIRIMFALLLLFYWFSAFGQSLLHLTWLCSTVRVLQGWWTWPVYKIITTTATITRVTNTSAMITSFQNNYHKGSNHKGNAEHKGNNLTSVQNN